jgi:hypothetical protein
MIPIIKNKDNTRFLIFILFYFCAEDEAEETMLKFIEKIQMLPGHEE